MTANNGDIEGRIQAILLDCSGGREVPSPSADLTEAGFDSLTKVEAITRIEKEFGIWFSECEITGANFATLSAITGMVQQHITDGH